MDNHQVTFQVDVGALRIVPLRNMLNEIKLVHGRNITWTEGEGWIVRPFWITTDTTTAAIIRNYFEEIEKKEQERETEEKRLIEERRANRWWRRAHRWLTK
jgi:hypothetical protein